MKDLFIIGVNNSYKFILRINQNSFTVRVLKFFNGIGLISIFFTIDEYNLLYIRIIFKKFWVFVGYIIAQSRYKSVNISINPQVSPKCSSHKKFVYWDSIYKVTRTDLWLEKYSLYKPGEKFFFLIKLNFYKKSLFSWL